MKKEETLFDKIIKKEIPSYIVYEDNKHLAFLDIFPFEKGHILVIPKHKFETILDMPEQEYLELQKIVLKIAKHVQKTTNCKGMNIWSNCKKIAGQLVPYVHFHICPRNDASKKWESGEKREKYLTKEIENYQRGLKLN